MMMGMCVSDGDRHLMRYHSKTKTAKNNNKIPGL